MAWHEYLVTGLASFFALAWALSLILSARNRTGGNIATVLLWWVSLAAVLLGAFSALHLLWIFPLALVVPALLLFGLGRL